MHGRTSASFKVTWIQQNLCILQGAWPDDDTNLKPEDSTAKLDGRQALFTSTISIPELIYAYQVPTKSGANMKCFPTQKKADVTRAGETRSSDKSYICTFEFLILVSCQ